MSEYTRLSIPYEQNVPNVCPRCASHVQGVGFVAKRPVKSVSQQFNPEIGIPRLQASGEGSPIGQAAAQYARCAESMGEPVMPLPGVPKGDVPGSGHC